MASDATGISALFSIPITAGQKMVGVRGFELLTSCSQSRRATGLRYTPVKKRHLQRGAFCDQRFWPLILRSNPSELEPKMVGRVGFEPTTNWLKANCSTN